MKFDIAIGEFASSVECKDDYAKLARIVSSVVRLNACMSPLEWVEKFRIIPECQFDTEVTYAAVYDLYYLVHKINTFINKAESEGFEMNDTERLLVLLSKQIIVISKKLDNLEHQLEDVEKSISDKIEDITNEISNIDVDDIAEQLKDAYIDTLESHLEDLEG